MTKKIVLILASFVSIVFIYTFSQTQEVSGQKNHFNEVKILGGPQNSAKLRTLEGPEAYA
jgi:hypothetical protein